MTKGSSQEPTGLCHVGLHAKDPASLAAFYQDVLGMKVVGGSPADSPFGASTFLSSRPGEESHEIVFFANASLAHTAFRVATIGELRARYADVVGRGIAIKESLAGRINNSQVSVEVLARKTLRKFFAARDLRRPWTSFRIHPKAFSAARSLDHRAKAILFGKIIMSHEALAAVGLPSVAADRPVKQKAAGGLGVSDAESHCHRATHAASHDPCRLDL